MLPGNKHFIMAGLSTSLLLFFINILLLWIKIKKMFKFECSWSQHEKLESAIPFPHFLMKGFLSVTHITYFRTKQTALRNNTESKMSTSMGL